MVGFYTLVASQLTVAQATTAVRKGMSKHFPIPVVLLARLAVDRRHQGSGLGAALLADALRRAVRASEHVGVQAVVVEAIDDKAAGFYRRFGFHALLRDELTLMATIADLRSASM